MWILIIFMYGDFINSQTIEFQNQATCEAAKTKIMNSSKHLNERIETICIEHFKK